MIADLESGAVWVGHGVGRQKVPGCWLSVHELTVCGPDGVGRAWRASTGGKFALDFGVAWMHSGCWVTRLEDLTWCGVPFRAGIACVDSCSNGGWWTCRRGLTWWAVLSLAGVACVDSRVMGFVGRAWRASIGGKRAVERLVLWILRGSMELKCREGSDLDWGACGAGMAFVDSGLDVVRVTCLKT
eukprot:2675231-Rhodomonas_salina.1